MITWLQNATGKHHRIIFGFLRMNHSLFRLSGDAGLPECPLRKLPLKEAPGLRTRN